ncbi:hypothetical protein NUSPORA_02937 [Nucleospora cyclopteri]
MPALAHRYTVTTTKVTDNKDGTNNYCESYDKLCTLETTENLLYLLRQLKPFYESETEIKDNFDAFSINVFKEGIEPQWEDPENIDGCSYNLLFKQGSVGNILFERLLCYFLLKGYKNLKVNGVKIDIRKNCIKFGIWCRAIPKLHEGSIVNHELAESLGLDYEANFGFKNHRQLVEKLQSENK